MDRISDIALLKQIHHAHGIGKRIQSKYSVTKAQFQILNACYQCQTKAHPFFYRPSVVSVLYWFNQGRVYDGVGQLLKLNMVRLDHKPRNQIDANMYSVTGTGVAVLKSYTNQLRHLIGKH